jgi:hypothetical protein
MNDILTRAQTDLQQRRAVLAGEISKIDAAIAALRPLLGESYASLTPFEIDVPVRRRSEPAAPPPTQPVSAAPVQEPPTPAANTARDPRRRVTGDEIVAIVRRLQPVRSSIVLRELGRPYAAHQIQLRQLVRSGRLAAHGQTTARVLTVPSTPQTEVPATAPVAPASPRVSATPAVAAAVEARDRAILARLDQGKATFEQLLTAMPDEGMLLDAQKLALKQALRRLTLKELVIDVGTAFQRRRG